MEKKTHKMAYIFVDSVFGYSLWSCPYFPPSIIIILRSFYEWVSFLRIICNTKIMWLWCSTFVEYDLKFIRLYLIFFYKIFKYLFFIFPYGNTFFFFLYLLLSVALFFPTLEFECNIFHKNLKFYLYPLIIMLYIYIYFIIYFIMSYGKCWVGNHLFVQKYSTLMPTS